MGFLDDSVKAKAGEVTKAASDGLADQQAKKKADTLFLELGKWTYAKHKGSFDEADANIARLLGELPPTRPSTASSAPRRRSRPAAAAAPARPRHHPHRRRRARPPRRRRLHHRPAGTAGRPPAGAAARTGPHRHRRPPAARAAPRLPVTRP